MSQYIDIVLREKRHATDRLMVRYSEDAEGKRFVKDSGYVSAHMASLFEGGPIMFKSGDIMVVKSREESK